MNFRLGVYDLFSRIVPGGFYLIAFGELARVFGWSKLDLSKLNDIGILPSVILLVIAYIVGSGMERIGSTWHRIFKKRGASKRVLESFKQQYADRWIIDFEDQDWSILRTYIYMHTPLVAEDADKFNALSIMLMNISLGLAILTVSEVIQFISTNNWIFLVFAALLILLSYQIAVRARTQRDWFYRYIFEAILAYRLNLEERIKPVKTKVYRKKV